MKGFPTRGLAVMLLAGAVAGRADTYTLTDLGSVTTNLEARSVMAGINSRSFVVQTFVTNGVPQARLYTGAWTNLGTLGGFNSFAEGLDESNRVVGSSLLPAGATNHAFLWTPGGTNGVAGNPQMKDLGTLGGSNSAAYDINYFGAVAGYAQNVSQEEHAARWSGCIRKS